MTKKLFFLLKIFLMVWVIMISQVQAQTPKFHSPKNIILFISDGWGYNHIRATNYFMDGQDITQSYESFPVQYPVSTYPARTSENTDLTYWRGGYVSALAWSDFDYHKQNATGSAEASTAMATGKKTYATSIGLDTENKELYNITQLAKDLGKAAGVVTSVPWSHATPAGFVAHNASRHNYEEIALEMLLDSRLDLIMGCGHPFYDDNGHALDAAVTSKYIGGDEVWKHIKSGDVTYHVASKSGNSVVQDCDGDGIPDPWTLVEGLLDFRALQSGNTPKRVLGMPKVHSTLQQNRSGMSDSVAFAVPFNTNVPSLREMTRGAINVLQNNTDGFFLMVEGGAVDWASHDNHGGRMIEEQHDFNQAVLAAIEWVEHMSSWKETLIIVTGDHECGYLTGPTPNDASHLSNPVLNQGKGHMPGMRFNSSHHTNTLIPLFAKGPGSDWFHLFADEVDFIHGPYINNTEIAQIMFLLWGKK